MTAHDDLRVLRTVRDQTGLLDPSSFHERAQELTRGSLPTSSVPGGSRSAEKPLPGSDRTDDWVAEQKRTFSAGIREANEALRRAVAAQNALCFVMGQNVTSPTLNAGETLEQAKRRAMREARDKAQAVLLDSETGRTHFTCRWCDQNKKRTPNERKRNGLCRACYDLWVAHGRPLHPPAEVIERRLARVSDTAAKEGTTCV